MPKQILWNEEIYLAPDIIGKYENNIPVIIDERNDDVRLDPTDIDDKIIIYEREVTEWFLEPALILLEEDSFKNSFIVLMVCMAYIEGVEQYKTGVLSNRRSKECFIESLQRIYPNRFRRQDLEELYKKSRCGLFHSGIVKGGVTFNNTCGNVFEFQNNGNRIKINPQLLLEDIRNDFSHFIGELREGAENGHASTIRTNFDRLFSVLS